MRSEGNTEQRTRTCHGVKDPNPYDNLFENAFCSIEVQIGHTPVFHVRDVCHAWPESIEDDLEYRSP